MSDEQQKGTAQNVLAFVLDQTLRLLHPFIPFIAEGIFQKLNEMVLKRGLPNIAEVPSSNVLVTAAWPRRIDQLIDEESEKNIESIQTVIRSIRDMRSQYNRAPSEKMQASASAPAETAAMLNRDAELICQLAGLDGFTAAAETAKPENAAAAIVEQMQVYLHDAIDVEAERARLLKQREQLENAKRGVEGKLKNENFVNKAKPEVVEQARAKFAELTEQLEAIEKHLAELV
jgi:valyl-tRNA synthetase